MTLIFQGKSVGWIHCSGLLSIPCLPHVYTKLQGVGATPGSVPLLGPNHSNPLMSPPAPRPQAIASDVENC